MNFHRPKVCRICRAPDNDDLISVRLIQDNITIARMVEELTGVQVMLDKNLPQNICLRCLERLGEAYQLRRQCIESDAILKKELYPSENERQPVKQESKDTIKLEIEALDGDEHEDTVFSEDESISKRRIDDLNIIVEEEDEENSQQEAVADHEDNKLAAAQELIDILGPDEDTSQPGTEDTEVATDDPSEEEIDETNSCDPADGLTLRNFGKDQYRLIATDHEYDLIEFTCLRCCGCEAIFQCREEFEAHSRDRHLRNRVEQDERNPYECSICYERFTKKSSLTFHRNRPNKRRAVCRLCEGIFKGKSSLRKHIVHCHEISTARDDVAESMELDVYEEEPEADECKSDMFSVQEVEYIEEEVPETLTEDEQDQTDDEEEKSEEEEENTRTKGDNKYVSTRQRKQMALIPGNFVRVIAEYDGYNIVEITKERCCSCLKFFDSLQELNEHAKGHQIESEQLLPLKGNTISYECEYCYKKFDIALLFIIHKRIREQKQFYQCRLCDFVIDSESRLKNHMLYNEQHAKFFNLIREDVSDRYDTIKLPGVRCCGCSSYFDDELSLMEHSRRRHPRDLNKDSDKRKHACSICDRRFNSAQEATIHKQKKTSAIRHYCKLCDFESPSEARMLKHLYSSIHNESLPAIEVQRVETGARKVGSVRYCCFDDCALPFHNIGKLQEHVQERHQAERESNKALVEADDHRWQCDCCGRVFRTGTLLKQHQFVRRVPKSFVCSVCGEAKTNKMALTVHEMKHTGERPFACDLCDKRFTSKTILNSHLKCHYPKQHQCPDCGEKFARGENLKRHIRHRHSEATFCCSYCPRKLKTREAQILHERSHTGEKPFQCRTEGCPKRYSSITDRRRHEMASHTGERPHKCTFCAASFVRKRQLTIHERKHTGERPFACEKCGKAFIDAPLLKKHVCC